MSNSSDNTKKIFTEDEIETAIKVLSKSLLVIKWCRGEAKAYGVEEGTEEYDRFMKSKSRKYAKKLITQ